MALLAVDDRAGRVRRPALPVNPVSRWSASGDEVEPEVVAAARRGGG